ncbi:hypothetical protein [Leptospira interrogans]|uniref:hypothetical protein n=1 Tax=Leptospira interrogans TaxID=173 RepID=UPI00036426FA|nr:hypothetical protein [Leptospira interrogans]
MRKKKTKEATYVGGVALVDTEFEDTLTCVVTLRNDGTKKINQGFDVKWTMLTKTGSKIDNQNSEVKEFLPPKIPVIWEYEKSFEYSKDQANDIRKRLSKTECTLNGLREIEQTIFKIRNNSNGYIR